MILIFFIFTAVHFVLFLETKEERIVRKVHLCIWAVAGHKQTVTATCAQSVNL